MIPRVGPIGGTSTTWPSRYMPEIPAIRPTRAVSIGSPIETSVPKVKSRMIIAAAMPTMMLRSVFGLETALPT